MVGLFIYFSSGACVPGWRVLVGGTLTESRPSRVQPAPCVVWEWEVLGWLVCTLLGPEGSVACWWRLLADHLPGLVICWWLVLVVGSLVF